MKNAYLKKVLAIYLTIGGVVLLTDIILTLGFWGILTSLLPVLMTIAIISFFIMTGVLNLFSNNVKYESLIDICLLIQTVQVVLLGFSIKNYYMPYLGFGFTDTPTFLFNFKFRFFDYVLSNGLKKQSDEISIAINLIPLSVIFIMNKLKSNNQSQSSQKLSFE